MRIELTRKPQNYAGMETKGKVHVETSNIGYMERKEDIKNKEKIGEYTAIKVAGYTIPVVETPEEIQVKETDAIIEREKKVKEGLLLNFTTEFNKNVDEQSEKLEKDMGEIIPRIVKKAKEEAKKEIKKELKKEEKDLCESAKKEMPKQ